LNPANFALTSIHLSSLLHTTNQDSVLFMEAERSLEVTLLLEETYRDLLETKARVYIKTEEHLCVYTSCEIGTLS
jgi:hypothetical protein